MHEAQNHGDSDGPHEEAVWKLPRIVTAACDSQSDQTAGAGHVIDVICQVGFEPLCMHQGMACWHACHTSCDVMNGLSGDLR